MIVQAVHPETGERITVELSEQQASELQQSTVNSVSRRKIESYIDNLDLSADAKELLSSLLDVTITVGKKVISVGQKIIEFALAIFDKFPNTTFGLVLGLLVGTLVGSIPFLGALLGPFILPVAAIFGLVSGYLNDNRDARLAAKVQEAVSAFAPLGDRA